MERLRVKLCKCSLERKGWNAKAWIINDLIKQIVLISQSNLLKVKVHFLRSVAVAFKNRRSTTCEMVHKSEATLKRNSAFAILAFFKIPFVRRSVGAKNEEMRNEEGLASFNLN